MQWINLEDRLPPNDVYVLVCSRHIKSGMNFVNICKRFNEKWLDDHDEKEVDLRRYCISHWMPVPDDPSKQVERKDKEEIIDQAWLDMADHIKSSVKEVMSKDDIEQQIWCAISQGVQDFLVDMNEELFERFMSNAFSEKMQDLEITFKMRKD